MTQLEKLIQLRDQYLLHKHNVVLYDYQKEVSDSIVEALIKNLRLTAGADEDDIKKLKPIEIPVEIARQSGKTTAIVHTVEFVMIFFPNLFDRKVHIGIFAPQREQAKTDFDRLKEALRESTEFTVVDDVSQKRAEEESNAKTLVLPNGSSCYVFPVTITSKPESKTLDLIIFEEAQDMDDNIVKAQIWPMGANTNAPRIYIGTAGVQICYFYRLVQTGKVLILDWEKIAQQKRQTYIATGDASHLIYEQFVRSEREKMGEGDDDFRRPYKLEWILGTGQFCVSEELDALITDRKRTFHEKQSECFVGVDTAKNPDSTVVTILRFNKDNKKKELLNWMELRGDNYKDQFDIICEFLKRYNVVALALDATGQGDFMPDMFERETVWQDENTGLYRVKFSAVNKDIIFKNLKVSIKELLTTLPELTTREGERFRQQMLDLQQEYKGQLLSVSHPDDANAHDDYPDSWALAEYAYARWMEGRVSLDVIDYGKAEKVKRGTTTDHWPGEEDWAA